MRRWVCAILMALAAASVAAPACAREWLGRLDHEATERVVLAIQRGDCAYAVKSLNSDLRDKHLNVLLLAGTMFEEGICLKQNWERAVAMYTTALREGSKQAAARLASGYAVARPQGQNTQDKAAALWWALRGNLGMPQPCIEPRPWLDDADRFTRVVAGWPRGLLDACAYVAGVQGTINGDMEFPPEAAAHSLRGSVRLLFVPAEGRVEVLNQEVEAVDPGGSIDGDRLGDRDTRAARSAIGRHVAKLSQRALRRYEQPAGIDPGWRVELSWTFNFVMY